MFSLLLKDLISDFYLNLVSFKSRIPLTSGLRGVRDVAFSGTEIYTQSVSSCFQILHGLCVSDHRSSEFYMTLAHHFIFSCNNGKCLDISLLCDFHYDCQGGEDEACGILFLFSCDISYFGLVSFQCGISLIFCFCCVLFLFRFYDISVVFLLSGITCTYMYIFSSSLWYFKLLSALWYSVLVF